MAGKGHPATAGAFVTPVVKDREGRRLIRTMRRTDKLQDLMNFYYDMVPNRPNVDRNRGKGVFLHRGRWIQGEETPEDCGMKDGDEIHFFPTMFVTLVLEDSKGRRLTRTMRRTDRMKSLMDYYNAMVPTASGGSFVLSDRGTLVKGSKTPADHELEDGDEISIY